MEKKNTSSSGSVLKEPEIQKLQMQAKIFKENSLNKLNALKSTTQLLEKQSILYQQAFAQLFGDSFRTFKFQLSQHMNNIETLLNAETLHEMDSKSALSVIKVQFERFINSDLLKPLDIYSRSFSSDREVIETFRDYTKMTAQTFKETIIQNMNSIEQCIIERASHEQELKMPVEKSSASKKPERQILTGHRFSHKKTTTVPEKTRTPRSCLRWQPTGRILKTVCLRWVPTGKLLNSCTGKVENEPTHGSNVDIPHIHACKQILISKKPVPECSGLVLHQMTSDHNRSELGIQDHNNEHSSSKLVPKVVPLAVKTATLRQELELLFHRHKSMLRTIGVSNGRHGSQAVFKTSYAYILHDMCQKIRVILSIHNEDGIPA
ncbi:hypothetical protein Tco_0619956 [Tanacetum coccineum]